MNTEKSKVCETIHSSISTLIIPPKPLICFLQLRGLHELEDLAYNVSNLPQLLKAHERIEILRDP